MEQMENQFFFRMFKNYLPGCTMANLFGRPGDDSVVQEGVMWYSFREQKQALKTLALKIRPVDYNSTSESGALFYNKNKENTEHIVLYTLRI